MTPASSGRAWLVVGGGAAAAAHIGKLPPALPVLREALGLTLVEAGFLLSLVQLAGMTLGLLVGLTADRLGLKRTMVAGLAIAGAASVAGGFVQTPAALLALRAAEGLGFLLAFMPGPGLIRRLVPRERMSGMLGVWGANMAFATALTLLCGPAWMAWAGWPAWWWLLGGMSLVLALSLVRHLPPDPHPVTTGAGAWSARVRQTLAAPGPWLVAFAFGVYSGQWLAVIGFLPSIYQAAGIHPSVAAVATAFAAGVNMTGSLVSGPLLQRGVPAPRLLAFGFATMGVCGVLAFADALPDSGPGPVLRYVAVLAFSAVGGVIPGTLFSLAVRLAPGEDTVSTTVGWMQQWSAFGQFLGPPAVAWVAARAGGWEWSWIVTGGCAACGLVLAALAARMPQARAH
ncbi:MFS transporter [Ramlibacter henchirensis]|uniref:MFS transporter n=1 Tax=Ramlibacter henchirensis TaxID=204072 RepID=A0A4Z0C7Q5_9BURK|nr:MFS transporter [Ramlibacter henchirensis]TFZ07311.1 MFS transporter [Ramlibacter henchirensis]